jgi:hypothetical protein
MSENDKRVGDTQVSDNKRDENRTDWPIATVMLGFMAAVVAVVYIIAKVWC